MVAPEIAGARPPTCRWLAYVSNDSGQMQMYLRPVAGQDRLPPVRRGATGTTKSSLVRQAIGSRIHQLRDGHCAHEDAHEFRLPPGSSVLKD